MSTPVCLYLQSTNLFEDVNDTRRIRAEQDRAYEESLEIDRRKVHRSRLIVLGGRVTNLCSA